MSELTATIKALGAAFEDFKKDQAGQLEDITKRVDDFEMHQNRSILFGGNASSREMQAGKFATTVKGQKIPVLAKGDRMADRFPRAEGSDWSIGDFVRGSMGLDVQASVLERGAATVPTAVSANIIDMIRAKNRVVQAGALTIPIEGPTNLCRIDADPDVYQHTEGATDITESTPTFTPVAVDPKSLVALIPLSMETVADSPNLDAALSMSLAAAFAGKLDALAIAALLADSNIPDSATGEATDAWAGTVAAVGSMLGLDMDVPTAMICNPADFVARASELATGGGTWLGAPPALANMLDLPSTAMTVGKAILGDFAQGVGIGVRQELRLEVVRWAKSTSASHLLVAYARMQAYVLQPTALYRQLATVV